MRNRPYTKTHFLILLGILLSVGTSVAQRVTVTIDPSIQKYVGEVTELERSKYFNMHTRWNDGDFTLEEMEEMRDVYGIGFGRSFWGPYSFAASKNNGQVGKYPTDDDLIDGWASQNINSMMNHIHAPATVDKTRSVITEHPGNVVRWSIDTNEGAKWAAEYFKRFFNDQLLPSHFEPMNEPFVHAGDDVFKEEQPDEAKMRQRMAEWFGAIGKEFHEQGIKTKVIGYSSAWPSMELWDFGHWESRMKMFMDVAGEYMDAFATHIYDGINVKGDHTLRSGSNSKAILDMIETYSMIKWGKVKPHAITEFGGIEQGYGDHYSDLRSVQSIKSINHIMMELIEREDRVDLAIPFITGKAIWHINPENNYEPYGAALKVPIDGQIGQPVGPNTKWRFTPRIHFFALWSDVKGKRISNISSDPDIQTQAFLDDNKVHLILNNLDDKNQKSIDLRFINGLGNFDEVTQKALKIYDTEMPVYTEETLSIAPQALNMEAGETVVLTYTMNTALQPNNSIHYKTYYNENQIVEIIDGRKMIYQMNGVDLMAGSGEATLQIGINRNHALSKQPRMLFNGHAVTVPTNWAGSDQQYRDSFFGVIDVPIPMSLVKENNTVEITFDDYGGAISTMILRVGTHKTFVAPPLSNDEQGKIDIEVFPTHVNDHFQVNTNNLQVDQLQIIDQMGRIREKKSIKSAQKQFRVDNLSLSKGIYFVKLSGLSGEFSKRIIVM
ncbi:T9SS type A sorting domain-containing protein [Persicobacter psychrovividus]|uniref:Beta-agarase n=1 Tax=Persicobacter psychrovividus TaxID=387638 RepID=A0ABM7VMV7_9BACT|nr:hypothetical protein PEPS_46060 [Persicobacter psychrovividus]